MTEKEQRHAASKFAEQWANRGYEKGESQPFWLSLLHDVLGVENVTEFISFENQIKLNKTSFIDGYIPSTHVLIEQKSIDKNLRTPIKQSDGKSLDPFQQAKRYALEMPYSKRPRWVVTCNFKSFLIYDMEHPGSDPEELLLKDLPSEYYRLHFLVDDTNQRLKKEKEVSIQAGQLVGMIYDEILAQYINPESQDTLRSLNILCVRLVFCLYAEDAGVFGRRNLFHDYLIKFPAEQLREAIISLFKVLNTPDDERDPYMEETLASFPYVSGGLFADDGIEIPRLNEKIRDLLIEKASDDFDWSLISPTIFGAAFESTLNQESRREGGMHYTSVENIHKVIGPLFLNDLDEELYDICNEPIRKTKTKRLKDFQDKISSLRFLDPACGSGNFLTETYLSLRKMENKVIKELYAGQMIMGEFFNPIKVNIGQFYGIEINDFAVSVATTALWIAESQMMDETEKIVNLDLNFLPLKSNSNIREANALDIDWNEIETNNNINFIMGNPPFYGARHMTSRQKDDVLRVFGKSWKGAGDLDYVSCWFKKADDYIKNSNIKCAFVSTNSISQGVSVINLWKPLISNGIHIDFAWRTFRWDNEANDTAQVHCVIIGFSRCYSSSKKIIYSEKGSTVANNINAYLIDAPDFYVERRTNPISPVPSFALGCTALDDSNYILTEEEKDSFIKENKGADNLLRPFMMGKDFINRKPRYCLWLKDVSPEDLNKYHDVKERIKRVRDFRLRSNRAGTLRAAETPTLFGSILIFDTKYLAIPKVSSGNREYIPIDILEPTVIPGDKIFCSNNATLYHFGVMTSCVHMAWTRIIGGRLKSDYSYSNTIVYNNFPWPCPTEEQTNKIEETAEAIFKARSKYPNSSYAVLYDDLLMPVELRKAHKENDKAVMAAYGLSLGTKYTDEDIVSELFKLYRKLQN